MRYLAILGLLLQVTHLRYVPATCVGTNVTTATTNLQGVVDAHPGTVLCFAAGTYTPTSTVHAAAGTIIWGAPGTIWDGQSTLTRAIYGTGGEIIDGGDPTVTVRGLEFQNYTGTAIQTGFHWTVRGNQIHNNLVGVDINSYSTVDSNHIYSNGKYGITGGPGTDLIILNNEVNHNNTGVGCPGSVCDTGDSGGSKIVGSSAGTYNLVWRNNYVHDNTNHGIWSDGNVRATYENNIVSNNGGSGIFHEISWDAIIRNNTLTNNDSTNVGQSCSWGANIYMQNSSNVEVYGNTINALNGSNGFCGVSLARSEAAPYPVAIANLSVHNNVVYLLTGATNGLRVEAGKVATSTGNSFTLNAYHVTSLTGAYWDWEIGAGGAAAYPATFAQWQSAGLDTGGSQVIYP